MTRLLLIWTAFLGLTTSCRQTDNNTSTTATADSVVVKVKLVDPPPIGEAVSPTTFHFETSDSLYIKQFVKDYNLSRIDIFAVGDVDGDGKKDKAIVQPLTFFFRNNKMDSQYVNITFTCSIPPIKHYNGFQGLVVNVGDLDGNNTDEILYYPDWYQSNSAGIYIYRYYQNKWTLLAKGSVRREKIAEAKDPIKFLKSLVKKVGKKSYELTEHTWSEDGSTIVDTTTTFYSVEVTDAIGSSTPGGQ